MKSLERLIASPILFVGTVCLACTGETSPQAHWSGEAIETGEGWVVRTPPDPLDTLQLEGLWSQQRDEWGDLGGIRIGAGRVLLRDRLDSHIHLLALSDGMPAVTFGRMGEGPGELGRLYSATIAQDKIYVSHAGSLDLSAYSLTGEFLGTVEWGNPVSGLDSWGHLGLAGIPLTRSDEVIGKQIDAAGPAEVLNSGFQSPYPGEQYGNCLHASARDGWVVRVLCSALRLRVEGTGVQTPFWVEHANAPVESSEAELDQYIARFWAMQPGDRPLTPIIQRQLASVRDGARIRPTYSRVRIDPSGNRIVVVEQPFGDQSWKPGVLHVFLGNGVYLGVAQTGLHIVDLDLRGDTVVVLARNPETDEPVVHALALRGDPTVAASAAAWTWGSPQ